MVLMAIFIQGKSTAESPAPVKRLRCEAPVKWTRQVCERASGKPNRLTSKLASKTSESLLWTLLSK